MNIIPLHFRTINMKYGNLNFQLKKKNTTELDNLFFFIILTKFNRLLSGKDIRLFSSA